MKKTFSANKSILVGIILLVIILPQFYQVVIPNIVNLDLIPLVIQLSKLSLVGFIWFGIRYEVSNEQLRIKLGPLNLYKLNIADIESFSRSYNPLSSPAPSLRRIKLKLRTGGTVLLSPKKEEIFFDTLAGLNPEIENNVKDDPSSTLSKLFLKLL